MIKGIQLPLARRIPFYYGWVIVLGAFLSAFVSGSLQGFGFSVFLKPMSLDLGWTRSALVGGLTLGSIGSALVAPKFGALVDRYGPRPLLVLAAITGGLSALVLSQVKELWQFYIVFLVGGATGGGVLHVAVQATVVKWFVRYRGRAVALSAMGAATSGAVLAPVIAFVIVSSGWRMAWLVSAALFFSVLLPVSFFMLRKPEDVGLLPDGAKAAAQAQTMRHARRHEPTRSWRRDEALRTKALWMMMAVMTTSGLGVAGVVVHEFSYVLDQGYSETIAASVLSTHASMAMGLRVPWGLVVERVPVRYCMAVIYLGCAIALGILLTARSAPMLFAFAVLYGASIAGSAVTSSVVFADYFGREHIGSIQGAVAPIGTAAFALGPLLASVLYDTQGNYAVAFLGILAMFLVAAVLALSAKPPVARVFPTAPVVER